MDDFSNFTFILSTEDAKTEIAGCERNCNQFWVQLVLSIPRRGCLQNGR